MVTSREFLEKGKIEPPGNVDVILLEDVKAGITATDRLDSLWCSRMLAPDPGARAQCRRAPSKPDARRHRDHHLQQRQHRRAQGRGPLAFQH